MNNTQKFKAGQVVLASDGMSAWERALIKGVYQQLSTDSVMYHIEFEEDGTKYLALEMELLPVDHDFTK